MDRNEISTEYRKLYLRREELNNTAVQILKDFQEDRENRKHFLVEHKTIMQEITSIGKRLDELQKIADSMEENK